MKVFIYSAIVLVTILAISLTFLLNQKLNDADKIKGITMVAPAHPFKSDPVKAIRETHANWIALVPYAFSFSGKPEVYYNDSKGQWWGETPAGIRESILLAKKSGMHIMLKPQVWMHDAWVGNMDYKTENEWTEWEDSYRKYILQLLSIAIEMKVEMFCIGTEYNIAAVNREKFFRSLINEIKGKYDGKLCYCATWNNYQDIHFWDLLDFIGISAYFPLSDESTPDVATLCNAWKRYQQELSSFSQKINKKILFTEFGYLSVNGCAGKTWETEKIITSISINQDAQANAYESLFASMWNQDWWAGGFVWKWFPNGEGHEGYPEKDYTPQSKKAMQVLTKWYAN